MPPSISIDGRGWWVSTNTGVWNGGFGPHQPRHSSSVPIPVHGPACGRAELPPAHDLGADGEAVPLSEGVVDPRAATGLAGRRAPPPGGEHPLVQPLPGVPERGVEREAVAGAEPIERDREVVHVDLGHDTSCTHSDRKGQLARRIVAKGERGAARGPPRHPAPRRRRAAGERTAARRLRGGHARRHRQRAPKRHGRRPPTGPARRSARPSVAQARRGAGTACWPVTGAAPPGSPRGGRAQATCPSPCARQDRHAVCCATATPRVTPPEELRPWPTSSTSSPSRRSGCSSAPSGRPSASTTPTSARSTSCWASSASAGGAAQVLAHLGVTSPQVRRAVERGLERGERPVGGDVRLTPGAKRVIEFTVEEARRLGHAHIGTEHLLLGLLREKKGPRGRRPRRGSASRWSGSGKRCSASAGWAVASPG